MNFQVTTDLQSLNLNGGSGSKGKATLSPAERPGGDLKVSAESVSPAAAGNSEPEGDLKVSAAEPGVPGVPGGQHGSIKALVKGEEVEHKVNGPFKNGLYTANNHQGKNQGLKAVRR